MFYACFRYKDKKEDGSQVIIKIPFEIRDKAKEYISIHMDLDKYDQCWTE